MSKYNLDKDDKDNLWEQKVEMIRFNLNNTHDVEHAKSQMQEMSRNPQLMLTPTQRGLLNWTAMKRDHSEMHIFRCLDLVISTANSEKVQCDTEINVSNIEFEVQQKLHAKFTWIIVDNIENNFMKDKKQHVQVDQTFYKTENEAKEKAQKFVTDLKRGDEKAWITFGITSWSNKLGQNDMVFMNGVEIDLLQMGKHLYVLICHDKRNSNLDQNTVVVTNKLMQMNVDDLINLKWVARGLLSNCFYVLYRICPSNLDSTAMNSQISLEELMKKLKTLFQ